MAQIKTENSLQNKIQASTILDDEQKQFFLEHLDALGETDRSELERFLEDEVTEIDAINKASDQKKSAVYNEFLDKLNLLKDVEAQKLKK